MTAGRFLAHVYLQSMCKSKEQKPRPRGRAGWADSQAARGTHGTGTEQASMPGRGSPPRDGFMQNACSCVHTVRAGVSSPLMKTHRGLELKNASEAGDSSDPRSLPPPACHLWGPLGGGPGMWGGLQAGLPAATRPRLPLCQGARSKASPI